MKLNHILPLVAALQERAKLLDGIGLADPFGEKKRVGLSEHVTASLNGMGEPADESVDALCTLMQRAVEGDHEAQLSLNRIRVETVQNALLPMAQFVTHFFDVQTLADDERPVVHSKMFNEMSFYYLSENGAPRIGRYTTQQDETYVDLHTLASSEIPYRPKDIYRGRRVGEALLDSFNIAYDLSMKLEVVARALLTTAIDTFVTTGRKASRTFQAHSSVVTSNLPTTNALTVSGNTTSTAFRHQVADTVFDYCSKWGVNSSPLGALTPTGIILVPSADAADLLGEVPIGGSANNPVSNALMQNFMRFDRGGVTWTIIPDATIEPNVCYPVLSRKVGTLYLKPSQDEVFDDSATVESRRKNLAHRSQTKVVGAYIAEQNRPNFISVRYRTAS